MLLTADRIGAEAGRVARTQNQSTELLGIFYEQTGNMEMEMNLEDYLPLIKETAGFFGYTMVELTVLFVGISFLVGLINEFMPQDKLRSWLSGRNGRGYLIGSLLGSLTPFCSCSTIPVTVGLLRAQAGFGPTMAFLFTSPLVNPIIIPLFITLLGVKVTVIYAVVAIGMTIGISFFLEQAGFFRYVMLDGIQGNSGINTVPVQNLDSVQSSACCEKESPSLNVVQLQPAMQCCGGATPTQTAVPLTAIPMHNPQPSRARRIFNDSVGQFKSLLPYVIIGVAIGSIIHGFLPADLVVRLAGTDNPLAVPISAIVGIPLYLRVSTMVPIAASLLAKGMSTGAVIALIIGGAGASLPEMAMLKGIFRLPLLIAFITSVMVMAISAGLLVNLVMI